MGGIEHDGGGRGREDRGEGESEDEDGASFWKNCGESGVSAQYYGPCGSFKMGTRREAEQGHRESQTVVRRHQVTPPPTPNYNHKIRGVK